MKLPRDTGGQELVKILSKYGYKPTRQTGSHIRLTSTLKGKEHHITIPNHKPLKTGTLDGILSEIANYLEINKKTLADKLFG